MRYLKVIEHGNLNVDVRDALHRFVLKDNLFELKKDGAYLDKLLSILPIRDFGNVKDGEFVVLSNYNSTDSYSAFVYKCNNFVRCIIYNDIEYSVFSLAIKKSDFCDLVPYVNCNGVLSVCRKRESVMLSGYGATSEYGLSVVSAGLSKVMRRGM